MKGLQIASFLAAIVLLLGFLMFGGLLILPQNRAHKAAVVDVSIEEEKKPDKTDEEKPKEIEEEKQQMPEKTPELKESPAPLDLSQLELALNPGLGDAAGGDFLTRGPALLSGQAAAAAASAAVDQVFALADLDQAPRVVFQPAPPYPPDMKKKKIQGTVYVLFIVDKDGRVKDPRVQRSDNPAFEGPAVGAVRRWRFDPGKVGGQTVQFRMRVPITFAL
jgi:protein TonB